MLELGNPRTETSAKNMGVHQREPPAGPGLECSSNRRITLSGRPALRSLHFGQLQEEEVTLVNLGSIGPHAIVFSAERHDNPRCQPSFLQHFPHDSFLRRLPRFHRASGNLNTRYFKRNVIVGEYKQSITTHHVGHNLENPFLMGLWLESAR